MKMSQVEYEKKLGYLESHGIRPEKLKRHNEHFFNAILFRIRGKSKCDNQFIEKELFWPEGNKELWEKCRPKKPQQDLKREETKVNIKVRNYRKKGKNKK